MDAIQTRIAEILGYNPLPVAPVGICVICGELGKMTRHHLAPKQLVNMGLSDRLEVVLICRECHNTIHVNFSNQQLLNTHWPDVVEKVKEEIQIAPLIAAQKLMRRNENEHNALLNKATPPHVRKQLKRVDRMRQKAAKRAFKPMVTSISGLWP